MGINYRPYVIRNLMDECECGECGMPLMLGDRAVYAEMRDGPDGTFCGQSCAAKGLRAEHLRNQQRYAAQTNW